jgi:murein DD-endopeptidase MepM/ murein hydrolase activator NlpD
MGGKMKLLKKISYVVAFIFFIVIEVAFPVEDNTVDADARTLRKMKNELAQLERELSENKAAQQNAQNNINNSKSRIEEITQEKVDIEEEVDDLTDEIKDLGKEIKSMNNEVKDIINYYQLSKSGDSGIVEYVFDANDYTDLTYRMAVTEQLSEYYSSTIKDYNKKIKANENKKEELADKKVSLTKKEGELEEYITAQKGKLAETMDGSIGIEEEIAALKKTINLYENTYKCKLDETIDECLRDKLPSGSSLYRPLITGRVTSNYGHRTYKLGGRWVSDFHYGVDLAGAHGQKVYSAGNGTVAAIFYHQSCGGNMIYINHKINGKKYTTCYYHMGSVNVRVGQNVTAQTVVGTQGGSSAEYWDRCSTGSHLHFGVSTGNWGNEFKSYSGFIARIINPRKVINIPSLGGSFSNRSSKY